MGACPHAPEPPGIRLCPGLETAPKNGFGILNITPVRSSRAIFGCFWGVASDFIFCVHLHLVRTFLGAFFEAGGAVANFFGLFGDFNFSRHIQVVLHFLVLFFEAGRAVFCFFWGCGRGLYFSRTSPC